MNAPFDILGTAMDAIGAALPQYVVPVAFTGNRPDGGVLSVVIDCCIYEAVEYPETPADGVAPSRERAWTLRIPKSKWPELDRPQVNDEVRFRDDRRIDVDVKCRVSAVAESIGYFTLAIQERKPQP